MIKLTLPPKPDELTQNETALREQFLADRSKTVWKQKYISEPLLQMSHDKCAYSEVRLNEESKYMEVEHFRHKDAYPEDVVTWGNLLPSCKTCNTAKGEWDVEADPIVNPLIDTPSEHLYLRACRFYGRDQKGWNTVDAVAINNVDQFMLPRFREANHIVDSLSKGLESLKEADTSRKKHVRIRMIKDTLKKCGPEYPYSACISTYVLYEWKGYAGFRAWLVDNGYWDDEFAEIETLLQSIALPE